MCVQDRGKLFCEFVIASVRLLLHGGPPCLLSRRTGMSPVYHIPPYLCTAQTQEPSYAWFSHATCSKLSSSNRRCFSRNETFNCTRCGCFSVSLISSACARVGATTWGSLIGASEMKKTPSTKS